MKKKTIARNEIFRVVLGAVVTVLCGLALWQMPLGEAWVNNSYDWPFRFGARAVTNRLVLIEMDTAAYAELHQRRGQPWDRALHAQLLDYLRGDGCPLVVFDIWFGEEREATGDAALAEALRRHENVVLMAKLADPSHPRMIGNQVFPPHPLFRDAATNWGLGQAGWEPDGVVRRIWSHPEPELNPTLSWTAARLAGAQLDPPNVAASDERWLGYYGPKGLWTRVSYHFATNQAPGFFRDKIVFIGNRPETPVPGDEQDEFRTPYTSRTGKGGSGMEIMATTFLNLMNRDWLRRLGWWQEALVLIIVGGGVGGTLALFRWPMVLGPGLGAFLFVGAAGVCLSLFSNWWFPWLVVAGGQIPVAVAWVCFTNLMVRRRPVPEKTAVLPSFPHTPGYERIEPAFGEGAYGKVWLVRNAIGEWQALKVMFRSKFKDEGPYDREFNGIKHHKPISNQHPGLLRIDFVSAKQPEGYFYYVMELGDALSPGWEHAPLTYKPRDLARVCGSTGKNRLPVQECLRIGMALAESLDFLHRQGLIHRDIKPSNVIFVKGHPKLADVGLVTEIQGTNREVSYVGTEGYLAPEGPGQPQGDIYSLGMLLYVISTGRPPSRNLDLSATMVENTLEFMPLNHVLWKACALEPSERYATAAELRVALTEVQQLLPGDAPTRLD